MCHFALDYIFILSFSIQKRGANIQSLIDSTGLESIIGNYSSLKSHKSKGSLKEVKSSTGRTVIENETEISKLSCEDLMELLMRKEYSIQDCQAFRGMFI